MTLEIHRRQMLATMAGLFTAGLFAPIARALANEIDPGMGPRIKVFSAKQRLLIGAFCERIIPTTDTPGAIEAGIVDYVEMMVGDWSSDTEKAGFLSDLDALEAHCQKHYGRGFSALDAKQQDEIVAKIEAGSLASVNTDFFEAMKQLTITGYYTSEVGMTVERKYLPVPGKYDGAYPYSKVGTLFTG